MTARVTPAVLSLRTPAREPDMPTRQRLTIADVCADLGISRSTFYEWRAKGRAPRCIKLPNGDIRINRADYERWLTTLEEVA